MTSTSTNRYKPLFQRLGKMYSSLLLDRPITILSFGCSSGAEISTLLEVYQNENTRVVGVEINDEQRSAAQTLFARNSQVTILTPSELVNASKPWCFDLIVACNVLCCHSTASTPPMLFFTFQHAVSTLASLLNPARGILFAYGTNYRTSDVALVPANEFQYVLFPVDSGPVTIYASDGKTKIPRSNANTFLIIRHSSTTQIPNQEVKKNVNDETTTQLSSSAAASSSRDFTVTLQCAKIPEQTRFVTWAITHPGKQSNNLGDYMQTLAQLNVLATFYNPATWECASQSIAHALATFAKCKPQGTNVRARQHPSRVKVVWLDRDASGTKTTTTFETKQEPPVYVIANGWFMHPIPATTTNNNDLLSFDFPFAPHIIPIFVSLHLAHPEIVDSERVCEYFRKHAPIGCRDLATCDLLRSKGIEAYFSGCLTSSLELPTEERSHDGWWSGSSERLFVDVNTPQKDNNNDSVVSHHIPCLATTLTPDQALHMALEHLVRYSYCEHITSTRIHCLLPTRAVSETSELVFCSKTQGQTGAWLHRPRFSGLVECMEDDVLREVHAMALFEQLVDYVHDVLFGASLISLDANDHSDILHLSRCSSFSARSVRLQHPGTIRCDIRTRWAATLQQSKVVEKVLPEKPFVRDFVLRKCPWYGLKAEDCMNILVTFDQTYYTKVFPRFLHHLASANRGVLLHIFCATREVASLLTIPTPGNIILHHFPLDDYVTFRNYTSPLHHVSQVCLDRLILPLLDLPMHCNRVVYLDLDICVLGSLMPLMHMDTGSKGIAAKTSQVPNVINSWVAKYGTEKIQYPHSKSFNAGVLVMDVDKLKREKMWDFCSQMYSKTGFNDQILLNFYAHAQYVELPPQFNIFVGQDHSHFSSLRGNQAIILHFVGSQKPWLHDTAQTYPHGTELWNLWHSNE